MGWCSEVSFWKSKIARPTGIPDTPSSHYTGIHIMVHRIPLKHRKNICLIRGLFPRADTKIGNIRRHTPTSDSHGAVHSVAWGEERKSGSTIIAHII